MNLKQLITFGIEESQEPVIKNPVMRAALQEPRTMAQEPRNMYQDGQLVQNTVDGSRTGYLMGGQVKNQNAWIKANPDKIFEELTSGQKYEVRKGNKNVGVGDFRPSGVDNATYRPLSKEGEKIAKHQYGTLDLSNRQRQRINSGNITMDTKLIKMDKETSISVKSKKGKPITDVDFKGMKMPDGTDMETSFLNDLKLKATQPQKQTKYGIKFFEKKYPNISERQLKRAIPFLFKREGLEHAQPDETTSRRLHQARRKVLESTDSGLQTGRISKTKTMILKDQNLVNAVDTAHRVSKKHMARLGLQFDTNIMGMDARIINQVIIRPSENKLDGLYKEQFDVFNKLKKKPTDTLRTQLANINKQVNDIVKTTSGRLVGVNIDPNTLETSFEGIKKKTSLTKFMGENISMKDLAEFGPRSEEQIEFLTKQLPKAVNAEINRGFVPNDFKKILSDKKSQEAILKYTKLRAPELMSQVKKAIKFPASKIAMRVMSIPIVAGAVLNTLTAPAEAGETSAVDKAKSWPVEHPWLTGGAATGASKLTKADPLKLLRKIPRKILSSLGTPAGAVAAWPLSAMGMKKAGWMEKDEPAFDIKSTGDRIGAEAELALAPSLVKWTDKLTKPIKNQAVRSGVTQLLNLGMKLPTAMKVARIASPIGLLSLAGEGIYHSGKKEMARRAQLSPEELADFHLERQSRGWSRAEAEDGIMSLKKKRW